MMGIADMFIAAITLENTEKIITRNRKHFMNIKDLMIIDW